MGEWESGFLRMIDGDNGNGEIGESGSFLRMGEWENGRMGEWENGRIGQWEASKA